jgi:signal transduction protein with GAF and PtsI domain
LGTLGERIAASRDAKGRQRAIDDALDDALAAFPGAVAELLLVQPDGRTLSVVAAKGMPSSEWDGSRCLIGEGLAGQAELQGQWREIADASTTMHLLVNPFLRQWGPRAIALAPLPRLGSLRGVLAVYSRQPSDFDGAGPHLMAVASQIALGLQGAQGEAVAVEASHAWSAAVDTGKAVRSSQNAAEAASAWVQGAREAFSTAQCGVYLLTAQGDVQRLAGHGSLPERFDPDSCRAWQQEAACTDAVTACPDCRSHGGAPGHVCVPLLWRQVPIGVVTIQGPSTAYWTESRLQLLTVMAELLAFGLISFRTAGRPAPADPGLD